MKSLNRVELIGNLARDAETKFTPGGTALTKFCVVTNRSWKDKKKDEWVEEAEFSNCTLWAHENLANYLLKGKRVFVAGRLSTRKYEDKNQVMRYSTEVVVEDVILLDGGKDGRKENDGHHDQRERPRQGVSQGAKQLADDGWGDSEWDSGGGITDDDPDSVPF